jgi:hypothetical protein
VLSTSSEPPPRRAMTMATGAFSRSPRGSKATLFASAKAVSFEAFDPGRLAAAICAAVG